ncbi:ribosomal protein L11 methyltransferase [Jannaschia pagri]|uniref:Ribosomal protein L11 methyltransferase n=1 Tax=Jannaschia pagri TaxID=2829797 RepID=A0ABQ4NIH5_9RHOB|nr:MULTISPECIES: 50S ribosomal protein L11 methyltransferase [unclassified Jannaschia]GIT89888.1 ribosomal protein L11 methyltransferase [Jannaschia sp. AI_61]GIT94005.1 ribosomal protein L11 methyltransferase [Jannaschia sp. AI_62]
MSDTVTPTSWTALTTLPGQAAAEALGDMLEDQLSPDGIGVFEMEDGSGLWEVGAYFAEAPDETALDILAAAHGAKPFVVSELPPTDWVAHVKRELQPVEAGRFFVYGSHDADRVPDGRVALLIEAAMAFGTGHHGTTQGCLLAFEDLVQAGIAPARVADVGAGTAVLAMAAARVFPEAAVVASDIDAVAVEVAEANLAVNGMAEGVTCVEAAGFDHPALRGDPFDLIFANILKGPLVALAPHMASAAAPGGHIILSGLLAPQADEVIAAYGAQGLTLLRQHPVGDWTTLTLTKA